MEALQSCNIGQRSELGPHSFASVIISARVSTVEAEKLQWLPFLAEDKVLQWLILDDFCNSCKHLAIGMFGPGWGDWGQRLSCMTQRAAGRDMRASGLCSLVQLWTNVSSCRGSSRCVIRVGCVSKWFHGPSTEVGVTSPDSLVFYHVWVRGFCNGLWVNLPDWWRLGCSALAESRWTWWNRCKSIAYSSPDR